MSCLHGGRFLTRDNVALYAIRLSVKRMDQSKTVGARIRAILDYAARYKFHICIYVCMYAIFNVQ